MYQPSKNALQIRRERNTVKGLQKSTQVRELAGQLVPWWQVHAARWTAMQHTHGSNISTCSLHPTHFTINPPKPQPTSAKRTRESCCCWPDVDVSPGLLQRSG